MADNYWAVQPGLNNVGSYQVSGEPWALSGIDAGDATKVAFSYLTRWIQVTNNDGAPLRVGFSEIGVSGSNYFTCPGSSSLGPGQTPVLELKVQQIWLYSPANPSSDVDVVAGLTGIAGVRCATDDGPSWSGSAGVG